MYCSKCGSPIREGSKFCGHCGEPVSIAAAPSASDNRPESSAPSYYEPLQTQDSADLVISPETDDFALIDISEPLVAAAPAMAEPEPQATQIVPQAQTTQQITPARQTKPSPKPVNTSKQSTRQGYLSSSDLWTWLKKDERRQLFFTDDREQLTEDDYMALVAQKLVENEVPARIEHKSIRWDNSDITSESYIVMPSSSAVNPLSCLLQFSNVGRFSFVEQKTFVAPPNLPPYPNRKIPVPSQDGAKYVGYGVALIIAALIVLASFGDNLRVLSLILFAAGGVLIAVGYPSIDRVRKAKQYNAECEQQKIAYNKAWKDWEDTVFLHSFQESTNGKISRIYQTVFESIKQVNAELFKDVETQEEREDTSMSELRQQISSLKERYR